MTLDDVVTELQAIAADLQDLRIFALAIIFALAALFVLQMLWFAPRFLNWWR